MGISFDPINKWILITSPTVLISALEIYSAAMDWCDNQPTISYDVPMAAVGKFDMGGGVYSDSIFMLMNGWKLKFWSGSYQAVVTGTLLSEPGQPRTAPPDWGNVEVVFQVSAQGTIEKPVIGDEEEQGIADEVWAAQTRGQKLDELRLIAALEATLTQIKGAGWTDETLKLLKTLLDDLNNKTTLVSPAQFRV